VNDRLVAITPQLLDKLLVSRRRATSSTHGLTAAEFARSVHCAERTLRRYLTGERPIPLSVLVAWEKVCGLKAGHLTSGVSSLSLPDEVAAAVRPLVGRSEELTQLSRLWARDSTESMVVIEGETGIGKTALAATAARAASEAGSAVLWGACEEHSRGAYRPFAQALWHRTEFVDLFQHAEYADFRPPAENNTESFFGGVADAIVSQRTKRTTVFVVDDLQWADPSSLALIRYLVRRSGELSLAIIATVNSTELRNSRHVAGALNSYRENCGASVGGAVATGEDNRRVAFLKLEGMRRRDVGTFIRQQHLVLKETGAVTRESADVDVDQLLNETGGNPFFLLETLERELQDGSPGAKFPIGESLSATIYRKVQRRSEVAIGILNVASIVGARFERSLVFDVLERCVASGSPDFADVAATCAPSDLDRGLAEAAHAGFVEETAPDEWRFVHHAYHRSIHEHLRRDAQEAIHRHIIDSLVAGRQSSDDLMLRLSYHVRNTDDVEPLAAAGFHLDAALRSYQGFDLDGALTLVTVGLALLDDSDAGHAPIRSDLLIVGAQAVLESDPPKAKAFALDAARAARVASDPKRLAAAAEAYGDFVLIGTTDPVTVSLCEEALSVLAPDEIAARSRVEAVLAATLVWSGFASKHDLLFVDQLLTRALEGGRTAGDQATIVRALHSRSANLHGSSDLNLRRSVADELELAGSRPTWHKGLALLAAGDGHAFAAEHRRFEQSKHPWDRGMGHLWAALRACLDARWADVLPAAEAARKVLPDNPNFRNSYFLRMFALMWEQDQLAGVIDVIETFVEELPGLQQYSLARAVFYWELGRPDEAAELVSRTARTLSEIPHDFGYPLILAIVIEISALVGNTPQAIAAAELLAPFSGQILVVPAGSHVHGAADRFLGIAADLSGDDGRADDLFSRAVFIEERLGGVSLLPRTNFWRGRGLSQRRDPDAKQRGQRLLTDTHAVSTQLQMPSVRRLIETTFG
jgi:AAA ATPase domain